MRLPEFNYAQKSWDIYNTFYTHNDVFTQFETGELMVVGSNINVHQRHVYERYGLQIVSTGDDDCPTLYNPETGNKVAKAHLNHGGAQHLCIDLNTKKAYRLGTDVRHSHISKRKTQTGPRHTHGASILWMHADAEPVSHRPIELVAPDNETRKAMDNKVLNEVKAACIAQERMGLLKGINAWEHKCQVKTNWVGASAEEILAGMEPVHRLFTARNGFEFAKKKSEVTYLVTEKRNDS